MRYRRGLTDYAISVIRGQGAIQADEVPPDEEIRRFRKNREGKKVSNYDWECPVDADATITRMKDGTIHLAYKAEHVVDLESGIVLGAVFYQGTASDTGSLEDPLNQAQIHLREAGQ